jgi:hypothetical protein
MANDFAGMLDASQRHVLLGIVQLIMLGELAVNRVLDNLELKADESPNTRSCGEGTSPLATGMVGSSWRLRSVQRSREHICPIFP